jgi:hypothetical protein
MGGGGDKQEYGVFCCVVFGRGGVGQFLEFDDGKVLDQSSLDPLQPKMVHIQLGLCICKEPPGSWANGDRSSRDSPHPGSPQVGARNPLRSRQAAA